MFFVFDWISALSSPYRGGGAVRPAPGKRAHPLARLELAGDRLIGVLQHLLILLCGSDRNSAHRAKEKAQHRNPENPIEIGRATCREKKLNTGILKIR